MEKRVFENENGNQFIAYEFDDATDGSPPDGDAADEGADTDGTDGEVD